MHLVGLFIQSTAVMLYTGKVEFEAFVLIEVGTHPKFSATSHLKATSWGSVVFKRMQIWTDKLQLTILPLIMSSE